MLRSRITPCLLVHKKGLVKTTNFKDSKYVGDPLNAVKIFNEKEVDELIVLDIDATSENRGPDFELIKNLAVECRMPFCYGGGVTTVEQAKKIISLGAEKVALSAAAINNINILKQIGDAVGVQSVVVVLDIKKKKLFGGYEIVTHNAKKPAKVILNDFVKQADSSAAFVSAARAQPPRVNPDRAARASICAMVLSSTEVEMDTEPDPTPCPFFWFPI